MYASTLNPNTAIMLLELYEFGLVVIQIAQWQDSGCPKTGTESHLGVNWEKLPSLRPICWEAQEAKHTAEFDNSTR